MTASSDDAPVNGDATNPVLAKAKYPFNGKNNDELTFEKDDVIIITQQIEGGWWEGTFNGHTGWFPSDYAVIFTEKDKLLRSHSVPSTALADSVKVMGDFLGKEKEFRQEVISDFLTYETGYIESLTRTHNDYLVPLKESKVLSDEEYARLASNLDEILALQSSVLADIRKELEKDVSAQRIGGVFIQAAPTLKTLLLKYCANHPLAVDVLTEKSSEISTFVSTLAGGEMKRLIMGLSEPFRHLDKYPVTLQELERNIQDTHIDRGDVQRSCAVYKELKQLCESVRKQKEMQMEFMASCKVGEWVSDATRGDIVRIGNCAVEVGEDSNDRCVAVFTRCVLVLEVAAELSSYQLREKCAVEGLTARKVEARHAVQIGTGATPLTLVVGSSFEVDRWLEALSRCEGLTVEERQPETLRPVTPKKYDVENMASFSPPRQPHVSVMPSAERAQVRKKHSIGTPVGGAPSGLGGMRFNHELEMILPDDMDESFGGVTGGGGGGTVNVGARRGMLPVPPADAAAAREQRGSVNVLMRRDVATAAADEDALLLRIIGGYCGASTAGAGSVSASQAPPQLIVADDEKILVEEEEQGVVVFKEKSLVDTVYALKDQLAAMQKEMSSLKSTVEKEQRARRRLEDTLRRESRGSGRLDGTMTSPDQVI